MSHCSCQEPSQHWRECAVAGRICGNFIFWSYRENGKLQPPEPADAKPLTENQKHILRLLAGGMSIEEVAKVEGKCRQTIDATLRTVRVKMDVETTREAVLKWQRADEK